MRHARKLTVVGALAIMSALAHTHPAHAYDPEGDAITDFIIQDMRHNEIMDALHDIQFQQCLNDPNWYPGMCMARFHPHVAPQPEPQSKP